MSTNGNHPAQGPDQLGGVAAETLDAFQTLYEAHLDEIYRFIFYQVSTRELAEDLTETTFVKALEALHKGTGGPILNARAWLYRIAKNAVIDNYRLRRNEMPIEWAAGRLAYETNLSAGLEAAEQSDLLQAALEMLDDRLRQVIVLRFLSELSHREVAAILDIKENHVRILQYRALKALRNILEEGQDERTRIS
jgi:RNA polymerase sigma-70 factor (ECF subfamily)